MRAGVCEHFAGQNLHLLTRRIVERNAETGEHSTVARNGWEYLGMLRSAAGGGAILGVTTFVKLLLTKLALAEFSGRLFRFELRRELRRNSIAWLYRCHQTTRHDRARAGTTHGRIAHGLTTRGPGG